MTATDTAPTAEVTHEPTQHLLTEIDLYLLAKPIADALGDGWSEDDDEAHVDVDRAIRLHHTDGRAIGIRHLWRGQAVQTFAIGAPSPESGGKTASPTSNRLPPETRYSTGVRFTTDSPLDEILNSIRTVLLPAFDGNRPPLNANGTRILPTPAGDQQTAASTDPSPKTKATKAAPAPANTKSSTRRSTAPANRTTKSPANRKPRRAAATAAA
ncbi:hypothetical protein J2Z21_008035 [Streptomyces griseochromogenes]|uniref:Uncharacterized protein n=1 Tax=Streptomyces griseochromogenes TaxID=68214 RepID=A0A1B1B4E0_9ACTN|nr:hypothetical protein [Streptomyces griseochromogenes]ANP53685.1 hypothetical protein AVL59_32745 [Streptomyces griseochromogenes]MBP2055023.1 hypothetical protein [Streptomyces griseochromogenes]